MRFCEQTLANGLEIVAEVNPQAYSAAFAFFVKTGSRDETDEVAGVSHFLEHMVFKGTATRSSFDVNRELDEIGSQSNAFTSEEQTVYYAAVLPEYQDRAVELLADILRPALRESDFADEKQVIIEEIYKYDDQPPFGAHEKCMAQHFGAHPLARSVLGTVQTVGALTPAQMRAYFERRYSPRNIALVAAGNVDFARLVAQAEKHCGGWQPFAAGRETARAPAHRGFQVIAKDTATQAYAVRIANGPAAEDDNRYAARLLSSIFGDDSGSRLFWEMTDKGLAEYAAMSTCEYQGTGAYMTFLSCAPEEAAANLQRLLDLERQIEREGITEKELTLAKNKICAHIVLAAERPTSRLFSVGNHWLQRREYRTVREVIERYQAVTRGGVEAVLAEYPFSQNTTVVVGPFASLAEPR